MTMSQTYTVREAAKLLGVGSKRLFAMLRNDGIFDSKNLPQQRYIDAEYFRTTLKNWQNPVAGMSHLYAKTFITEKGVKWLDKKINQHTTEGTQA